MKKICVLTATRAEYGLLKPTIKELLKNNNLDVRIAVTGMHLEKEYGSTYKEIEEDGIKIDIKIPIVEEAEYASTMSLTMANALLGFSKYFRDNKFDLLLVLGDRYETLAVCIAAMNEKLPIAHIAGGEQTLGLIDEAIRHSITKMSQLHFTSTSKYRKRVIQLGEDPSTVFNVGATGIENIINMKLLSKTEFEESINVKLNKPFILVTFHPETLLDLSPEKQLTNLLSVCDNHPEYEYIITKANADEGGLTINEMLDKYAEKKENVHVYSSLGLLRYLSAIKHCKAVVGNSSSGIIEVPVFLKPTINIGDRQKGRERPKSVIDCGNTIDEIEEAFRTIANMERLKFRVEDNPYYKESTSKEIAKIIDEKVSNDISLIKKFYDL